MLDGIFEDGQEFLNTLKEVVENGSCKVKNQRSVLSFSEQGMDTHRGQDLEDLLFTTPLQVCFRAAKTINTSIRDREEAMKKMGLYAVELQKHMKDQELHS